jgi:hypothetical protein
MLIFKEAMQARRLATALPIRLDDIPEQLFHRHRSTPYSGRCLLVLAARRITHFHHDLQSFGLAGHA